MSRRSAFISGTITKLLATLTTLRDLGNTLIVVEHDEETIRSADFIVDIGPGAGGARRRGRWWPGPRRRARLRAGASPASTPRRAQIPVPLGAPPTDGRALTVTGATENNLKSVDRGFRSVFFICVTGVSGSGKSTLVNDILYRRLAQALYRGWLWSRSARPAALPARHRADPEPEPVHSQHLASAYQGRRPG